MSGIKAPFPWFGGKAKAADIIWSRFGYCKNYVEPFAGSLAVLPNGEHQALVLPSPECSCSPSSSGGAE